MLIHCCEEVTAIHRADTNTRLRTPLTVRKVITRLQNISFMRPDYYFGSQTCPLGVQLAYSLSVSTCTSLSCDVLCVYLYDDTWLHDTEEKLIK